MIKIDTTSILKLIETGLSSDLINKKENAVTVKKASVTNNTALVVEFHPKNNTAIDIKGEMYYIMRFVASFAMDNPYFPKSIKNICTRAYDKHDKEILYAISALDFLQRKESKEIEWLTTTLFQENTEDYRLLQAKKKISELENSLRKLIAIRLKEDHGENWWNTHIQVKIRHSAEEYFEAQNGFVSTNGPELIEFTYLAALKKIITTQWKSFRKIFTNKVAFENHMTRLNEIRRVEGHNRDITENLLNELDAIHRALMSEIGSHFPQFAEQYLVLNWRSRLMEIIQPAKLPFSEQDIQSQKFESLKMAQSVLNLQKLAGHFRRIIEQLNTIVVPPHKSSLHDELIQIFQDLVLGYDEIVDAAKTADMEGILEAKNTVDTITLKKEDFLRKYLSSEA